MKCAKKIWLIIAVCLIVLGAVIGTVSLAMLNFNFPYLSTEKFIESEQLIDEDFNNIKIDVNTSDIKFVLSNDEKCRVISIDTDKTKHVATVNKDTLLISAEDNRKWYDHIGISFGNTSLTVVLPKHSYAALNITGDTSDIVVPQDFVFDTAEIETDTGDVMFLASATEKLDISTDTGKIEIGAVGLRGNIYKNINLKSSTGDIKLWLIVAQEIITVKSSTGDVWFGVVEAPHVTVKTSTGDVEGNLYTAPQFITKTDTGDVNVPPARTDDVFEVTTNTGDIYFKVVK